MGTKELIEKGIKGFLDEVPALKKLKLVFRLDLRARRDTQTWRVELPGVEVTKSIPGDVLIDVSIPRPQFNELVEDGRLDRWREAYELGLIKATGDPQMIKLVGNVVERQEQRKKLKKVRR